MKLAFSMSTVNFGLLRPVLLEVLGAGGASGPLQAFSSLSWMESA